MGIRGQPAPNVYKLPPAVGYRHHDPTLWRDPAYTLRRKHLEGPSGLGPGLYQLGNTTRFGPAKAPAPTMGFKLPELYDYSSPGPVYYHPEKCYFPKQIPPKFTMAKRTSLTAPSRAPAPNTYMLPSALGPRVPDKHCNGAYTMGLKIKTPRGDGVPGPNKYGPVRPDSYKPAGACFTMRPKPTLPRDKTQKPSPNSYFLRPLNVNKPKSSAFSLSKRDGGARMTYFTLDDIRQ